MQSSVWSCPTPSHLQQSLLPAGSEAPRATSRLSAGTCMKGSKEEGGGETRGEEELEEGREEGGGEGKERRREGGSEGLKEKRMRSQGRGE